MDTFTWNIKESIPINIFIADPNSGLALTGQSDFIDLTIKRESDSKYWTGTNWSSTLTTLSVTEVSSTNEPGRYTYTLSSLANVSSSRYVVHVKIDNSPTIVADAYELHVSRDLTVNVYESEAV